MIAYAFAMQSVDEISKTNGQQQRYTVGKITATKHI